MKKILEKYFKNYKIIKITSQKFYIEGANTISIEELKKIGKDIESLVDIITLEQQLNYNRRFSYSIGPLFDGNKNLVGMFVIFSKNIISEVA